MRIIQLAFSEGALLEDITWSTMVLFPKGKGGHQGIVLVKVTWKLCVGVVNCQLKRGVDLHDALHGSRKWRGTRTATL